MRRGKGSGALRSLARSTGRSWGPKPSLFASAASTCFGVAPTISARRFEL